MHTIACLLAGVALSAPSVLTHHGQLSFDGAPVDDDVGITFRLYDGSSAGSYLWEEDHTVAVTGGYYSVVLGSITPVPSALAAASDDLWLGLSINGGVELTPRLRLTSVPYALGAAVATTAEDVACIGCIGAPEVAFFYAGGDAQGGAAVDLACTSTCVSTGEVESGAITTSKIADANVTRDKLAPCAGNEVLRYDGTAGWQCTDALVITAGGDVGIGIASPGRALDVAGTIRASQFVQLPVYTTSYASSGDQTPEVYEITAAAVGPTACNAGMRGSLFVGRVSGPGAQDALCVCMNIAGAYSWRCFNP